MTILIWTFSFLAVGAAYPRWPSIGGGGGGRGGGRGAAVLLRDHQKEKLKRKKTDFGKS